MPTLNDYLILSAILFAIGYAYRGELRDVADRVMAEFLPGHAVGRAHVVEIGRLSGNFSVTAQLNNGARVAMVIDTGASSVVLTQDAARAAGLPVEVLTYTVNIETANGRTRAAPVTLDYVTADGTATARWRCAARTGWRAACSSSGSSTSSAAAAR